MAPQPSEHTSGAAPSISRLWIKRIPGLGEAKIAGLLFILLLGINIALNPARFAPSSLGTTLGLAAPLILVAIASTPVILAGGGGIDISVGPLMGLLNVLIVQFMFMNWGITSPWLVIPFALAVGVASGLANGFLAAVLRIQPIVATLGTYLIYSGVTVWLMPSPGGSVPPWLARLSGSMSVVPILIVVLAWWLLRRTPFYEHLMAAGGDDRAAFSSGVPLTKVRIGAYVITGLFTAVAAFSLSALLGSADPTVGPTYTLTAIAAVALGGVSLAGGRGGVVGAILGAVVIFLLQSILTFFNVSTFALQVAYGVILVIAISLNSAQLQGWLRRSRGGE